MKRLAVFVFFLATPAWAQSYDIRLSAEEVNYLGNVLGKEPFKDVASLLIKIQNQINAQNGEKHGKGIDGSGNVAAPKGDEKPGAKSP